MAYYLAVETEVQKDKHEGINIRKALQFQKISTSDELFDCTLEEINRFTTLFYDEKRLRHELYSEKLLPKHHYYKDFVIVYINGSEKRQVQGKLLFADSRKYIEKPQLVIDYIVNRINENDISFFRQLETLISYDQTTTYLLSKVIQQIEQKLLFQDTNKYIVSEKLANNTAHALIQDLSIDEEGTIKFSGNLNYEKFHSTVSFISDYENSLKQNKTSNYKKTKKNQNTSQTK